MKINFLTLSWEQLTNTQQKNIHNLETYENNFSLSSIYQKDNLIKFFLAIKCDKQIIGFLSYKIHDNTIDIYNILVENTYKKQKIATKLLSNFFSYNILLEVNENNIIAKEFYLKNNFEILKKIPNYYARQDTCLVMHRKRD